MIKYKLLHIAIIVLMNFSPNFANDFYSKFHQRDYKLEFERIELIGYNKSVLNFVEVKTFKYNRTQPVVNYTINSKVNMGNEVEIAIQLYKFLSNEYRELAGSSFQVNWCKSFNSNLVGLQISLKCGNVTSCRIVKDTTYTVCNFYPDESQFSSFIPNGQYRRQVDGIYLNEIFVSLGMYLKVYRPIARSKKHKSVY